MEENGITNSNNQKIIPIVAAVAILFGLLGGVIGGLLEDKRINLTSSGVNVSNVKVNEDSAVIDVANKVSPAVVSITGTQERLDFFGNTSQSKSAGTGFIVSKDGLIITNKHVVSDGSASYSVFTNDGKEYKAQIKATDPLNDIAFIKIDANNLPVVALGNSDDVKIGQRVVAIGNALGQYQNSVTTGVVSAVGRAIQAGDSAGGSTESLENVIQTDAAINQGNSGGPLLNLEGHVVGINTAVDQSGQSIGFAIPINVAKSALESVIASGKVVRPMLGVRYIPISKEFATRNYLPVNEGAFVYGGNSNAVVAGGPAASAGIQQGDIITKVNNDLITSTHSLSSILTKYKPGDKVTITYIRDKQTKTTQATLQESK